MIWLIAVSVNLGGMLLIYSFLAFGLARLRWHARGSLAVLLTIIVAGLFWIAPAMIAFGYSVAGTSASYSLCFGDWLVSAFAVVLFCRAVNEIPRQLEDSARLDGCSGLGTFWHVVLPLVQRELGLIAFLLIMATALPFWANLTGPGATDLRPLFAFGDYDSITTMLAVSVISSLPVVAIFFAAQRRARHFARVASI